MEKAVGHAQRHLRPPGFPPPLWGRVRVGGAVNTMTVLAFGKPPPPAPPHKGEGAAPRMCWKLPHIGVLPS